MKVEIDVLVSTISGATFNKLSMMALSGKLWQFSTEMLRTPLLNTVVPALSPLLLWSRSEKCKTEVFYIYTPSHGFREVYVGRLTLDSIFQLSSKSTVPCRTQNSQFFHSVVIMQACQLLYLQTYHRQLQIKPLTGSEDIMCLLSVDSSALLHTPLQRSTSGFGLPANP